MKEEELYKMFKTEMEEEDAEKEADDDQEIKKKLNKAPPRKLKTHEPQHRLKKHKSNTIEGCDS